MALPEQRSVTASEKRASSSQPLNIGLCYDLRDEHRADGLSEEDLAEFDQPATIDALAGALLELGHSVDRIGGLKALLPRLLRGDRWDLVFNITEGRHGLGREAQVPAILEAYEIPYTFSDALVAAVSLHKGMTKHLLRDQGIATAPFAVIAELSQLDELQMPFPLLAKPVAEGTSKGIGSDAVARDAASLRTLCERLLTSYRQPVLVEAFLPGRELTVGLLGTGAEARSIGALDISLLAGADAEVCTFRNKEQCESLVHYQVVNDPEAQAAEQLALRAWRAMGARDAGRVDLRADANGAFQVLEINPLSGMHPSHSDLPILWSQGGRRYVDLIAAIVASARVRIAARN